VRQKLEAAPFSLVFQALQHFFSLQVYHPQDHPSSSLGLSDSLQNTSSGTGNNSLWLQRQDQSYVESRLFGRLWGCDVDDLNSIRSPPGDEDSPSRPQEILQTILESLKTSTGQDVVTLRNDIPWSSDGELTPHFPSNILDCP
jgi:hypothetical protein